MKRRGVNIYAYEDYATYLSAYYDSEKQRSRGFSFRAFAMRAGVSTSLLNDIIAKRRTLTVETMRKYAGAMGLSQRETEYFELMVRFVNEKDTGIKMSRLTDLALARKCDFLRPMEQSQYEVYLKWYHNAIRIMVTLQEFRDDPAWIASHLKPRITAAQAKSSLELLHRLGLIQRDAEGKWIQSNSMITSEAETHSLALRTFNADMLSLAREAMDRFSLEDREISTLTLGVSRDCYRGIKQKIRDFKLQLLGMVLQDRVPSDVVCQVNFQLFPLFDKTPVKEEK